MKINVRHEPAGAGISQEGAEPSPERTCVWVVGADGETTDTVYIESGEEVHISASGENVTLSVGVAEAVETPEPEAAAEEPGGEQASQGTTGENATDIP